MAKNGKSKGRKLPEILTPAEQTALVEQPNERYPTGLRNKAMLKLMLDAGLRAAELLALQTGDINWMTGRIHIKNGKGAKDRIVHINDDLLELLRHWRERRPVEAPLVFTTLKGGKVNPAYLRVMVKRYGQRAGIGKDVHPHLLRHTFASDLLRATGNLRVVQSALGHALIATTQVYLHLVDGELEHAMRTFRQSAPATGSAG